VALTVTVKLPVAVPAISCSVVDDVAPELIVRDESASLPVKPAGWTVARANVAAGQLDELLFLTFTVQVVELPALMFPFD